MSLNTEGAQYIQATTGLEPNHFADLIRVTQVIVDPAVGLSGRQVSVNWDTFDIPPGVVANLQALGQAYPYASPYVAMDEVWQQLTPESRSWFIENRHNLWRLEEAFPPLDED